MAYIKDITLYIITKARRHSSFIIISCVLGACIYYLISVSWLKCGDLIIDTYRELWLPTQINEGRVLYKDIFYPFGFLAPYILAGAYRLFGVTIYAAITCGIITVIAMSFVIYRISRLFLDELFSLLATLTFLFVFAFGFYCYNCIFNFILPYTFASTFCILFIASALYFFIKFILTEKEKYLAFWSVFLSLAFFSRPDMPAPALIVFVFIALLFAFKNGSTGIKRVLLWSISPVVISVSVYALLLFKDNSFGGFVDSILGYIGGPAQNVLSIRWMGLDNIFLNVGLSAWSFFSHFLIIFLLGIASLMLYAFMNDKKAHYLKAILGLILICLIYIFINKHLFPYIQYDCMPLLLVCGSVLFLAKAMYRKENRKENFSLATIFMISSTNILRIFLKTNPFNYGFYMLSIGIICYYVFFAKTFKDFVSRSLKGGDRLFSLVLAVFFAGLIIPYWTSSEYGYSMRTLKTNTGMGTVLYWDNSVGTNFWKTVNYLKENTSKDDKVIVFPEGIAINFFAGRKMPLRNYIFAPYEIFKIGEDSIISDLIRFDVDYVVILSRDTTEYGYPSFGIDYAKKLFLWIKYNYEPVQQFGPVPYSSKEFGITIFRKKAHTGVK